MAGRRARNRKIGAVLLIAGLAVSLMAHFVGSRELMRYDGGWKLISSPELGYGIKVYDAHPPESEYGRVVISGGFGSGAQIYFPIAITLLRAGYAVRLVNHSGTPNSPLRMYYDNHHIESSEAALDFVSGKAGVPLFLVGHSEGTKYAVVTGREIPSVRGVVITSPVTASIDSKQPPNVLILVAESDFDTVKRQAHLLLMNGVRQARPEFGTLYGDFGLGTARCAEIIKDANHFNIFLRRSTQRLLVDWLNGITGNSDEDVRTTNPLRFPVLAIFAIVGAGISVIGIGLFFPSAETLKFRKAFPPWVILLAFVAGWGPAPIIGGIIPFVPEIPLLVYGRVLALFAVAALPLVILAAVRPGAGAGVPQGPWGARLALMGLTATMLLFNHWLVGVIPTGSRLVWFLIAALITGSYLALDEFLRRATQAAADWQTGFALGLAGAFIAALSVAGAGFLLWSPLDQFLIGGSITLFVLMAGCEVFATYLYATTQDWFLSWWVRVTVMNGFLAGVAPMLSEDAFRGMVS